MGLPTLFIEPVARLTALLLTLLSRTWRVQRRGQEHISEVSPENPVVLAFFHGDQVPMVVLHRQRGFAAMASWSADGELLSRIVTHLGFRPVRGSSSYGGRRAFLESIRCIFAGGRSPGLAVDGPRGPRFQAHRGAAALSAATQKPIIYGVVLSSRAWRARSWDALQVPWPFSKVELRYGRMEPPVADREDIDRATGELGRKLRLLMDSWP